MLVDEITITLIDPQGVVSTCPQFYNQAFQPLPGVSAVLNWFFVKALSAIFRFGGRQTFYIPSGIRVADTSNLSEIFVPPKTNRSSQSVGVKGA